MCDIPHNGVLQTDLCIMFHFVPSTRHHLFEGTKHKQAWLQTFAVTCPEKLVDAVLLYFCLAQLQHRLVISAIVLLDQSQKSATPAISWCFFQWHNIFYHYQICHALVSFWRDITWRNTHASMAWNNSGDAIHLKWHGFGFCWRVMLDGLITYIRNFGSSSLFSLLIGRNSSSFTTVRHFAIATAACLFSICLWNNNCCMTQTYWKQWVWYFGCCVITPSGWEKKYWHCQIHICPVHPWGTLFCAHSVIYSFCP